MNKEDQNIEYKQSWHDEYLKWICGFANADGGWMLIGVTDDKKGNELVGVPDWKSLLETIPNLMRDTMGMIADVNHVRKEGKDNALVHKDYSSFIPIQISVSDDKLYVANVGTLPEDWTLEKLLGKHSSRPHNPTIASCVYLTGKIETWGRGIRKVFDECARHGCPPPVYEVSAGDPGDIQVRIDAAPDAIVQGESGDGTHEVITSATVNATVNATVTDLIFDAIKNNPGIRRPGLLLLLPMVKRGTLTRKLAELSDRIEFRGSPKSGGYYPRPVLRPQS